MGVHGCLPRLHHLQTTSDADLVGVNEDRRAAGDPRDPRLNQGPERRHGSDADDVPGRDIDVDGLDEVLK